jgi:hypothetical protein
VGELRTLTLRYGMMRWRRDMDREQLGGTIPTEGGLLPTLTSMYVPCYLAAPCLLLGNHTASSAL